MFTTYSFTAFVASFLYSLASSAPTTALQLNAPLPANNNSLPPLISLEEHFIAYALANSSWNAEKIVDSPLPGDELELSYYTPEQLSKALDVSSGRIQDLDSAGIAVQIISQIPTTHVPPANLCIAANTELAAATHAHPDRLAGFALLPMLDPVAAATELQRAVKDLGFLGTLIPNHANGRYYDDAFFWPVFEMAQDLDVPVYLHPSYTADSQVQHFAGNYSDIMSLVLATYGYGWHADTALSFLRAWAGGLFDAFPRLKMILGHDGEGMPFWMNRTQGALDEYKTNGSRSLLDVWETNVWVTTSGQFTLAPFASVLESVHPSKIMFSVDFPIATNQEGVDFMSLLKDSGLVSTAELEMIAHGNAEELLGITLKT